MGCLVLTTSNCKAGRTATVLGHLSRLLISTMTAMPMLSSAPRSLVAPIYIMGWLRRPYQLQLLMLRLLVRPRDFASPMTNDLGSSVAGIGDINDDGYDDVAVGAPAAATVCVVFGNEYMRNDDAPAEYKCDDLDPDSDNSP